MRNAHINNAKQLFPCKLSGVRANILNDGSMLLFNPYTLESISLNALGALFWLLADGVRSIDEIADDTKAVLSHLITKADAKQKELMPETGLKAMLYSFATELKEAGLIVLENCPLGSNISSTTGNCPRK